MGAGVAGLAVAALLPRDRFDVRLFERVTEFGHIGAGIQISPNGATILHRLGVGHLMRSRGLVADSIEFRSWDTGRISCRTPLGAELGRRYGAPYYIIQRFQLHRTLADLIDYHDIAFDAECLRVHDDRDHASIEFSDGRMVDADLVIGADGVHSVVRRSILNDGPPADSGYVVYRGLVPLRALSNWAGRTSITFWLGPDRHVTCYPVGDTMHFSAIVPGGGLRGAEGRDLTVDFAGWHGPVLQLIGYSRPDSSWPLWDRPMSPSWGRARTILIGDAAHPMLPFMSQGANQGLEDAAVLAAVLTGASLDTIPVALRRFEACRIPRVSRIHQMSRDRAVSFHLINRAEQCARDEKLRATAGLEHHDWLYEYVPANEIRTVAS
ncbi:MULTISPECIES: FAD-dependent monooxygenase [unclassified Nocardia]|uniref:FAD-dependent monooxygenase n=1 Tax=unclassified Nocardia TaxID=2637762 RepID=UPI0027DF19DA|nr:MULTISPECIES: FAD-dependent monooxygenase [unclassified Nocardia]